MNKEFFEAYLQGFSRTSEEYIKASLLADNKYIDKFMSQHSDTVRTNDRLLGEATDIEMYLFVIEWSLCLRIIGRNNQFEAPWADQDEDRVNELKKRLRELRNDLDITQSNINELLKERFKDKFENFKNNSGLLDRHYHVSKEFGVGHEGYIFEIKEGKKIIVENQYPPRGD